MKKNFLKLLLPCALLASHLSYAEIDIPPQFNKASNFLIADQFNNRVIEINHSGTIVWHFGSGPNDISGNSPIAVTDAERIHTGTLITSPGLPTGSVLCPSGCPDNRVMVVNPQGHIIHHYGQFGVTGSGNDELNHPTQARWLPNNNVVITDKGNQRVIVVNIKNSKKPIRYQYGHTGITGTADNFLNNPNSAEFLWAQGRFLIADSGNNRVIEVNRQNSTIVRTFTAGNGLNNPSFASRLPNGNTLITDTGHNRVIEVNNNDVVVWDTTGSVSLNQPTRAIRASNGNTVISDQLNDRVIVIDKDKNIVRTFGTFGTPGFNTDNATFLNAPYDAKVIKDFTGISRPF